MEKSSKKVYEVINKELKVGIFGDYGYGASATALLGNYFLL